MKLPRITSSNVFSVLLVLCVLCVFVFDEKSVEGLKKERVDDGGRSIIFSTLYARTHKQYARKHGTHLHHD